VSDLVLRTNVQVGQKQYRVDEDITADNVHKAEKSLAAAKTGTLTVRTDNDTGTLTLQASHGVITGDKIDIYWTGGSRRSVTVGVVSVNSVPIDLGAGDNLPAAATTLTVMVVDDETVNIVGANVVALAVKAPTQKACTVVFCQADGTEIKAYVVPAGESRVWTTGSGVTNPVTGQTIGKIRMTHGDSAAARTVLAHVLYN
jgi:hypothetical protein